MPDASHHLGHDEDPGSNDDRLFEPRDDLLRLALETSNTGLWDWDVSSGRTYFSDQFYRVLGYKPCELPMHTATWRRLAHPEDLGPFLDQMNSHFAGRIPVFSAVMRLATKGGGWHWIRNVGRLVDRDAEGRPRRAIGVCLDYTEQKQIEEQLARQAQDVRDAHALLEDQTMELIEKAAQLEQFRDEAEAASRAKSAFLANMSHEIRTPIGAMLGFAELLESGEISGEEGQRALARIRQNGEHLISIVNGILDLSKIEADRMTIEWMDCSPVAVAREVTEMLASKAEAKGVGLESVFATPMPASVRSDPTRLRQILMNLLTNAIKFTQTGSVRVVVSSAPPPGGGGEARLTFDVIDTGVGMTRPQVSRLFTPFMQADDSMTRRFGGTGLGLTISRRLARMLGGDVEVVRTAPGKGTLMRATIAAVPSGPVGAVEARDAHWPVRPTPRPVEPLAGASILLAEDGDDNRRLICHVLGRAGARVTTASDGAAALEIVGRSGPFDLIVMDMQMPRVDGYAATGRLRDRGVRTPVIALTANAMSGDREKCLNAGCDDYATKPIDRVRLVEQCAALIDRSAGLRAA